MNVGILKIGYLEVLTVCRVFQIKCGDARHFVCHLIKFKQENMADNLFSF